jgi:hypothetical protein
MVHEHRAALAAKPHADDVNPCADAIVERVHEVAAEAVVRDLADVHLRGRRETADAGGGIASGAYDPRAQRAMARRILRPGSRVSACAHITPLDVAELPVAGRDAGIDQSDLDPPAGLRLRQSIESHGAFAPARFVDLCQRPHGDDVDRIGLQRRSAPAQAPIAVARLNP